MSYTDRSEKAEICAGIGAITGCMAANVAIVWGGVTVDNMLVDYLHVSNMVARGMTDAIAMYLSALISYPIGILGGTTIGQAIGESDPQPIIDLSKGVGEYVSKSYREFIKNL